MRKPLFALSSSLLTLALAVLPQQALAQSDDGASAENDIVVTAQRRDERSIDVPISVTSISPDQLSAAGVNDLSGIVRVTPSLRFDSQGPAVQPTIRGVGTAITTSGGGPNVGIYVDGFFQNNPHVADFQLMRTQSVQVLKGPQGTLFGRNTTGGAILVTTADPSAEPVVMLKAGYGRFNTFTAQGYASAGSDTVAGDIEVQYRRSDNHFTSLITGSNSIGKIEDWSIRAGLKVNFTPDVSLLLRYTHAQVNDPMTQLVNAYVDHSGEAGFLSQVSAAGRTIYGATSSQGRPLVYFYAPAATYATTPGQVRLDGATAVDTTSDTFQATFKADLGFADLTSYTQYRTDNTGYLGDLDATALGFFNIFVGPDDSTTSQEFLLTSKPGSALQWTAGANYFQNRDTWDVKAGFGTPATLPFGGSSTNTRSFAAFLDMTYQLSERFFVTAGARYSHDEVADSYFLTNFTTFSYTGPTGLPVPFSGGPGVSIPVATLKNDSVTPRFVLRYKPDDNSSIYASYTRGYKAGILNVGGQSQQPVKPENIDAFEVGYKFDDRVFSLDLSAFYYDYTNLQVSSYQSGAAQIRNAAASEIYGAELQMRYRVSSAFDIYGGAAWTHARYTSFPNAPYYSWCDPAAAATSAVYCVPIASGGFGPGGLVQTSVDASGFKMQRSPDFTGNIGASYTADLGSSGELKLAGNVYYTSSFYFDPEQQFRQDGYALLSARAEWTDRSEHFTFAVFGENLTGKRYQTQVLFNTLGIGSVWSAPATYGIELGVKF